MQEVDIGSRIFKRMLAKDHRIFYDVALFQAYVRISLAD